MIPHLHAFAESSHSPYMAVFGPFGARAITDTRTDQEGLES